MHKWSHVITSDTHFLNEWAAIESARCLAFDLKVYDGFHTSAVPVPSRINPTAPSTTRRKVGFASDVDVLIGSEIDLKMYHIKVPADYLALRISPWRTPQTYFHLGELEPLSAMAVSSPPQLGYKPNRNEDPQLMDPSDGSDSDGDRPHRERDPRRPPFHTLPSWVAEVWNLLQEQGAVEMAEEGPIIYLQSYYISHVHHPHEVDGRPLRFDRDYVDWAQEIMAIWEDLWDVHASFDLHIVRPDPPVQATQGTAGIVLVVQHQRPDLTACLTTTVFNELPRLRIVHAAHSMQHWMTPRQILEHGQALQICDQLQWSGHSRCTIQAGRRRYSFDHDIRIHDGLGLLINVPLRIQLKNGSVESFNIMANNCSDICQMNIQRMPSTPAAHDEWKMSVVFSLDRQSKEVDLPWNDGRLLKVKVAEAFGCQAETIEHVCFIPHPPRDLVDLDLQGFLLERSSEVPQVEFLRLTLLDIEYQADRRGPQERISRYAKWIPRRSTRMSIIRLAGFEGHCFPPPDRCTLHHNHRQVYLDHSGPLNIRHGDYLRITVPSHPEEPEDALCREDSPEPDPEDVADELSTLQLEVNTSWKIDQDDVVRHHSIDQCSRSPEAPTVLLRRHGTRDTPRPGTDPLWNLWNRPSLRTRGINNRPVIIFESWYLSSLGYPRCSRSRLVALDEDLDAWIDRLRQVWRDRASPHVHLELAVVHPEVADAGHGGHLIVLQAVAPTEKASLISSYWGSRQGALQDRFAQLVDHTLSFGALLQFSDLEILCSDPDYDCRALVGDHTFEPHEIWPIYHGLHLELLIDYVPLGQAALGFVAPSDAFDLPQSSESAESTNFHPGPAATSSASMLPNLETMSAFVQDLHADWPSQAISWENEELQYDLLTWFVDHHDVHLRSCHLPRYVRISDRYDRWETLIRQAWRDHVREDDALRFYRVFPAPPHFGSDILAQVIVVRNHNDLFASSILTVFDESGQRNRPPLQVAITTLQQINLAHVLMGLGLHDRCLLPHGDLQCVAWHAQQSFLPAVPIDGSNGMSIVMQLRQRMQAPAPHVPAPAPVSSASFLQTSVHIHRTPESESGGCERLTGSRMALHCRPHPPIPLSVPSLAILRCERLTDSRMAYNCRPHQFCPIQSAIDVPDDGRRESSRFCFNPDASPFNPILPPLDTQSDFVRDLHVHWDECAFAWEAEPRMARIVTYFVNHHDPFPRCDHGRIVQLFDNYVMWEEIIKRAWQDHLDPTAPIEYFVEFPQPYMMEFGVAAYVIVVQNEHAALVTSLVSLLDGQGQLQGRSAVTTHEHITGPRLLESMGLMLHCFGPDSPFTCWIWHGDQPLQHDRRVPGRCGHSFAIQLRPRLFMTLPHTNLLQTKAVLQHKSTIENATMLSKYVTSDVLAPEPQPGDNVTAPATILSLNQLLHSNEGPHCAADQAITIFREDGVPANPPFIVIDSRQATSDIPLALAEWGIQDKYVILLSHECIFLLDANSNLELWIYVPDQADTLAEKIFHRGQETMTDRDHMRVLHAHGQCKAVILRFEHPCARVHYVFYVNVVADSPERPCRDRKKTAWATPQPQLAALALLYDCSTIADYRPACRLDLGITGDDLRSLFNSAPDILHKDFQGIELPDICQTLLDECVSHVHIDRLVIYADGSSQAHHRRKPPQWIDEFDVNDSWCFAVFGENYQSEQLMFLGLHCQQVIYDPEAPHFTGTEHIGADAAEREALLWAGLWRLSQNHRLPTLFRTDSSLTKGQALGEIGTSQDHAPLRLLRATFQASEAVLPNDCLRVEHVMGHAGDPLNELVDFFAKREATQSLYLQRQQIDLRTWNHVLPHLWMLLTASPDVPVFTAQGFDIGAPQLPMGAVPSEREAPQMEAMSQITLSVCSANVRSLYSKPQGHAGKLDYLRQQMKLLHINVVGLQETRTTAGSSCAEDIFRLSSGDSHGHFGVELWVNLSQPIAQVHGRSIHLQREDLVVVHASPRILLVLHDHVMLRMWFLVAHGPQSGRDADEREDWWHGLSALVFQHVQSDPLYVMIDANASTGTQDGIHVFENDDTPSANTPFFRAFLQTHELCIPATGSLHEGPSSTWTSPIDGSDHRIDYVLVRQSYLPSCRLSQVLPELDLGHHGDHEAVILQLAWTQLWSSPRRDPMHPSGAYQRDKISRAGLQVPLREYSPLPWKTDIDTQVQHFNGFLRATLSHYCRPSKKEPKKSHISAEIWQCRADRIQTKRQMQQTQRLMRRELLARLFSEWKCGCNPVQDGQIQFYTSLMCSKFRLYAKLRTFGRQLRLQLQHAKGQFLDQRLKDMPPDVSASSVLHELKTIIGSTNRRKQQRPPLPMIVRADGQPCNTTKQLRECWIQFFQHMECGQRLDSEALRRIWHQNLRRFQQEHVDLSASAIPSLYDLEAAFRCVKNNKATGQDGVPSEVCHACPAALARMVYTQLLKLCAHGQEALVHKGGQLVMAYKNKGAQSNPASYRSLMISSHIAKTLHRCLRSKQATYYERYLQTQQIGGRRRVPVQLGVHMVRAYLRAQIQQHKSVAVIFLDLQEAFYRVMRPLSVGEPMTDDALAAMLQRLNMPSSAIEELMQLLEMPCATAEAGLPAHLRLALQATHTDTHFFIAGQSDHVRTQAGSRPGDPFADVVFGFLFSRILTTLAHRLQEHELLTVLPPGSPACLLGGSCGALQDADPRPFIGPTWMDDLAICLAADTASSLEQKAAMTTGILLEVCLEHGVTPNVSKGKTEILLSLRGLGSRAMRRKYFSQQQGQVMQILHEHGTQSVAVVGSYTHLGGKAHHSGECKVEARRRISIANEAFTQYRRQLFQNRHIAVDRRRELFSTLVLSKLTYGMETWVFDQKDITDYVYAAIMRLYKRVLKIPATQHVDDQELLAQAGLPSPKTLFRGARLRYLLMLISCETVVPWGLLDQDIHWRDLVRADLRWLWNYVKDTSTLQDPDQHPQAWIYILRYHGKYWKTLVHRAIKLDILKHRDQWQLRHIHAGVFAQLQDTGSLHLSVPQVQEPAPQNHYGCLRCRKRCKTRAGEAAHMFKVHGIVAEFRHMSDSTSCPACLREYHTVDRLHAHLRRASHCQARLRGMKIWRPVTPGIGSRYNAQLRREHDGLLPFQPAEGPSFAPGPLLEALSYHLETYEQLAQLCFEDGHRGLRFLQDQGRDLISQQVISWTMLLQTLDSFQQDFTDEDCELASLSLDDKQRLLHHLRDPDTWPFLQGEVCAADPKPHIEALETYEHWCEQLAALHDDEVWHADVTRPQAVFREKIVLHAYSGRRRHGDFQWFLDACAQAHPDAIIHVVSVDIVIDTELGDIGKEAVREMWYEGMRQGRRGPRILRDVCHLWGFTSVSLREMEQLFDGHQLLGFSATSMVILATTNALGLLEHPAEPAAPDAASIWRVPLLKLLSRLPGMRRFSMAQGLLGAPSPKPTDLMALNLPSLPRHFVQWALCKDLPKGRSIGTNDAGEYHTAGLKEYPPAMCAAIAQAFFDQLHQPQAPGTDQPSVPPGFLDRCKSLIVTDMGAAFGPDFVPGN
eukprot:s1574_g14.t1